MRSTNIINFFRIVIPILLLATLGALAGWVLSFDLDQPLYWLIAGTFFGIFLGALLVSALLQWRDQQEKLKQPTGNPGRSHPGSSDPPDDEPYAYVARLHVPHAFTKEHIPVALDVLLTHTSSTTARGGDAQTHAGETSDPGQGLLDLVIGSVNAAATEVIGQHTIDDTMQSDAPTDLAEKMIGVINAQLAPWQQEVLTLTIENIRPPVELSQTYTANWIHDRDAEIQRQIEAARARELDKRLAVLSNAYKDAKARHVRKSKLARKVLIPFLQDLKQEAKARGVWPTTLNDLLAKLNGLAPDDPDFPRSNPLSRFRFWSRR